MKNPESPNTKSHALAAVFATIAGVTLALYATPAFAPEPARLTSSLSGANGSDASAIYLTTNTATSVVRWPGSWAVNTTLKPGTPCSTYNLPAGSTTTQVIYAQGNYRKCQ